jgi:dTDP-4-amino-4,6-dideoxygalactose transaminase
MPFKNKRIKIITYKCNQFLEPDIKDITTLIKEFKPKVFILIHYFGVDYADDSLLKILRHNKIILIEDCVHGFMSTYENGEYLGSKGDISFYSFSKVLPVPDGALFILNNYDVSSNINISKKNFYNQIAFVLHLLYLKLKRVTINYNSQYLNIFEKLIYFFYYKFLCYNKSTTSISKYSNERLAFFNYQKIRNARIDNLKFYHNILGSSFINHKINKNSVLTGYPIISTNKKKIWGFLNKNNVEVLSYNKYWFFPEYFEKEKFKEEYFIYNNHFCLPLNENIKPDQINKIIDLLIKFNN